MMDPEPDRVCSQTPEIAARLESHRIHIFQAMFSADQTTMRMLFHQNYHRSRIHMCIVFDFKDDPRGIPLPLYTASD